jgi:TonB family protein
VAQVVVRVAVDESGAVSGAKIEPGGSRYFGKLSLEAARKWRFAPASGSRDWLLRFEITRTETKAFAAPDAAR